MPVSTHFELDVHAADRWSRRERFAEADRDAAVAMAERLDQNDNNDGVRLVRITAFGAGHEPVKTVEWMTPGLAAETPPARRRPEAVPTAAPSPEPAAGTEVSPHMLGLGIRVFVGGLTIGLLAFFPASTLVDELVQRGTQISPALQRIVVFTIMMGTFLIAALITAYLVLAVEERHTAPRPAPAAPEPTPPPQPEAAPAATAAPQATEPPPAAAHEPAPEPEAIDLGFDVGRPAAEPTTAVTAEHRRDMALFLERAMLVLKPRIKAFDPHMVFGLRLFLGGAGERFGAAIGLRNIQKFVLIREAITAQGADPEEIEAFCEKFLDYDSDPKFRVMTDAGQEIMEMYLGHNHACFRELPGILQDWVGPPAARAEAQGVVTVMVTDLAPETGLPLEDALRDHNRIVRKALAECHGTEIRHTGSGIVARFTAAGGGINGAIMIQRAFAEVDGPTSMVRIGLDASAGGDDRDAELERAVEGAAMICAAARPGGILVSEEVTALTAGDAANFREMEPPGDGGRLLLEVTRRPDPDHH